MSRKDTGKKLLELLLLAMKEMTPADERFARAYAQSHLKQHYDAVVVDDACGIGGFLWKFPSEGSNSSSGSSTAHARVLPLAIHCSSDAAPVYPRKCSKCERAWVSDRNAERRHRRACAGNSSSKSHIVSNTTLQVDRDDRHTDAHASPRDTAQCVSTTKLGVARRVWCEVDDTLSQLQVRHGGHPSDISGYYVSLSNAHHVDNGRLIQWRADKESAQDGATCAIPFSEILEITQRQDVPNSFQIVTTAPRTVVFQCRPSHATTDCADDGDTERALTGASVTHCMDVEQWCEYLDVFSQYARQQQSNQRQSPRAKDTAPLVSDGDAPSVASDAPTYDEHAFARITRAIIHDDVSALDALLATDAESLPRMTDDSGSSLLIVALKLGAGAQIIQTLLGAGVDCNALNHEYVKQRRCCSRDEQTQDGWTNRRYRCGDGLAH